MAPPFVKSKTKVTRAPRADAARNRERILATALKMFAAGGLSVLVEEIAKHAKVGIGTLYRHFPTKDALIAAIVVERFEQMTVYAESLSAAPDAGVALAAVLERLVIVAAAKKDFVEAIGGPDKLMAAGVDVVRKRFKAVIAGLLTRAQAAGAVRGDVTATDLIALVRGVSFAADGEKARMRHLSIVLAGLRA